MNINKLLTITALTSLLGLSSFIGIREKESILAKGDEAPSQKIITVDPNQKWGNGTETYKVATCFYDDSHKGWSDLVTIEAPKTYIEMSYEVDFTPTSLVVYRYNKDFSKENWLTDPTGENYQDYGWTSSPVLNKTYPIDYDNDTPHNDVINIILENESYGFNDLPYCTHQHYLPDQKTWESETFYLADIKENEAKHVSYSVTLNLKNKDTIIFDKYFEDVSGVDIEYASDVTSTDFDYWKNEIHSGLDYNGNNQTYSLHLDYKNHTVLINKILNPTPEPTPEPKKSDYAYIYIAVAASVVAAVGIGFGATMLIRKRHKKI